MLGVLGVLSDWGYLARGGGGRMIALLWLFGCVLSAMWLLVSLPPCALDWSVVCPGHNHLLFQ